MNVKDEFDTLPKNFKNRIEMQLKAIGNRQL